MCLTTGKPFVRQIAHFHFNGGRGAKHKHIIAAANGNSTKTFTELLLFFVTQAHYFAGFTKLLLYVGRFFC
jgi:hypothetical protein